MRGRGVTSEGVFGGDSGRVYMMDTPRSPSRVGPTLDHV